MLKRENKAIESEGKEELVKGKHGLYNATHVRQSAREVWTILSMIIYDVIHHC